MTIAPASLDLPFALGALAPDERLRLGSAGLRTFFNIVDRWALTVDDQGRLLGDIGRSTLYDWRRSAPSAPSAYSTDLLTRLSCVVGIYGALQRLYRGSPTFAHAWLSAPNAGRAYAGRSPLAVMLDRGLPGMLLVRRLLESESAGGLIAATPEQPVLWDRVAAAAAPRS